MIYPVNTVSIRTAPKLSEKSAAASQTADKNNVKKNDKTLKTITIEQVHPEINGREFSSLEEAVKEIIKIYDPKVLAFGEFHNYKENGVRTTGEYFRDIIPLLASEGFRNAVIETAMTDQAFKDELASLRAIAKNASSATVEEKKKLVNDAISIKNTPMINRTIVRSIDKNGVRAVIISLALQDDVSVSGPLDYETWDKYYWDKIPDKAMWKITNDGELNAIRGSLAKKAKVFSYTGGKHNDILTKYPEFSFGDDLSKDIKGKYLEIDLLVPEYASDNDDIWPKELADKVPVSGVKVIVAGTSRHIYIIFARSPQLPPQNTPDKK